MKHNTVNSVVKGLAAGAVIGTATYMMTQGKKKSTTNLKRTTGKALKTVGSVMENISYMMK